MTEVKRFKVILEQATSLAKGLMVVGMDRSDVKQHLVEKGYLPQVAQLATRHANHELYPGDRR